MIKICFICLRGDLNLRPLHPDLEDFYEDLCDYDNISKPKLCAECMARLDKFLRFKKLCHLSALKLKKWKSQSLIERKPISQLHLEIRCPRLDFIHKRNSKVFICKSLERTPKQISNFKLPHIVTANIPAAGEADENTNDDILMVEHHKVDPVGIETRKVGQKSLERNNDNNFMEVEYLHGSNELDSDMDSTEVAEEWLEEEFSDDNLITIENTLKEIQQMYAVKERKKVNKVEKVIRNSKSIIIYPNYKKLEPRNEIEDIVRSLLKGIKDLKDEGGVTINVNAILKNLDKLSITKLFALERAFSGLDHLTKETFNKIAEISKEATQYQATFDFINLTTKEEIEAEFARRRVYPEYLDSKHHCDSCIQGFQNKIILDQHMTASHDQAMPFECGLCRRRYTSRQNALKHIGAAHTRLFRCKLCPNYVTNQRQYMVIHHNRHQGHVYTCKYCGLALKKGSSLYKHYNTAHKASHICALCASAFDGEAGLRLHTRIKHKGEEFVPSEHNRKCDECDVTFANDDVYRTHLRITHKDFNDNNGERKINFKKLVCRVCKTECDGPGWLTAHFRKEHPNINMGEVYGTVKNYLCPLCGKRFKDVTTYNDHQNTHTGAKPFACSKCPKRFHRRHNLKMHYQRHLPPSRECKECGKMFTTALGLMVHMRTHTNERRHKCEVCGKGFNFAGVMRKHIATVHNNVKRINKQSLSVDKARRVRATNLVSD